VYWGGNVKERENLGGLDVDGRVILKWNFRNLVGGMDWIDLAHDRDSWRAVLNAGMNLRDP